jgi:hypothetical protein
MRVEHGDNSRSSIARSARYPRVAVALGVQKQWHVPLLLCRALSTVSVAWWACQTCFSIYRLLHEDLLTRASHHAPSGLLENETFWRIAVAQVGLSFVWVRFLGLVHLSFDSVLVEKRGSLL